MTTPDDDLDVDDPCVCSHERDVHAYGDGCHPCSSCPCACYFPDPDDL